jgi:hypothetical protein
MTESTIQAVEVICPVCGRPMTLLHTIRRAFAEKVERAPVQALRVLDDRAGELDI